MCVALRLGASALTALHATGSAHAYNGSISDLAANKAGNAHVAALRQLAALPNDALQKRCAATRRGRHPAISGRAEQLTHSEVVERVALPSHQIGSIAGWVRG